MIDFGKPADLTFLTDDHPEADGRAPQPGEIAYQIFFTLERERVLCIECGHEGLANLLSLLRRMESIPEDTRIIDEAGD